MLMSIWASDKVRLTENFVSTEFKSRTYPVIFIDTELVKILQGIRNALGKPINVSSGFRTETHNKSVGGSKNSAHLMGKAADIWVAGTSARDVARIAAALYGRTIAIGCHEKENYVHIDIVYAGNWYLNSLVNKVRSFE